MAAAAADDLSDEDDEILYAGAGVELRSICLLGRNGCRCPSKLTWRNRSTERMRSNNERSYFKKMSVTFKEEEQVTTQE